MSFVIKPFSTTGIGSLPHRNVDDACELVLKTLDIPFWPQLPQRSFKELMIPQYSEGFPFVRLNDKEQNIWVLRDDSDELDRFYESCTEESKIAISEDYAFGLHAFLRKIKGRRFNTLKGHVTGPVTFTLGLKDNFGRYIYFDEELREIACMLLKAKVRWQIDLLKQHAEQVIIFIDEPILSALGSSTYLGVDAGEAARLLREVALTVENCGGVPGIHCCGRADWPMVMNAGFKILNFDSCEYFDTLAIYHAEIKGFLENGGCLAWGAVPTSDAVITAQEDALAGMLRRNIDALCKYLPEDLVKTRIILTPACGAGSRTVEESIKIFQLLLRLKESVS